MLGHGGAIQDAVAVGGPLDVAQPAWPVRVAHQVGVKRDRVIAGIACAHKCGTMRSQPIPLETDDEAGGFPRAAKLLATCSQCEFDVFYLI